MTADKTVRSLAIEAARALIRLDKLIEIALSEINMTRPEYLLLSSLGQDEMTASLLAEKGAVTQANVSLLVNNLLKRKLIKRTTDPQDTRRRPLSLTKVGRTRLEEADEICAMELIQVLETFAPGNPDIASVLCSLQHFAEALDEALIIRRNLPFDHTHSIREIAKILENHDDDLNRGSKSKWRKNMATG